MRKVFVVVLVALAVSPARAAVDPAVKCFGKRLQAASGLVSQVTRCHAKAVAKGLAPDDACVSKARGKYDKRVAKAERGGGCVALFDPTLAGPEGERTGTALRALLAPGGERSKCGARSLKAAGALGATLLGAHATTAGKKGVEKLPGTVERAEAGLERALEKAGRAGDCATDADATAIRDVVETVVDFELAALSATGFETITIPSGAEPARTPGSPGTDASAYPKLVAQFGTADVDLNRATYTRHYYQPGTAQPDAVLILVPGFEGGAHDFKILAENLITRALEHGLRLEVWAYDRRGQQLEDRAGVAIATAMHDPAIALDWFFGEELGQPLNPALSRRAQFHDVHADTAFIATWTELTFSRDIDAIVEAAHAVVRNGNVFLGGHSAGTGFTARYAATDFDLTGDGPADPGYEKLRGLVLLEGPGGSTSGATPSDDVLDRIEDRADGGLFFAVRDDAPRCVDGTPCTVDTEDVDCAGKGRGTCTASTAGFSIVAGLLNPRVLASVEPGAVQFLAGGGAEQVILQVDQGAPGNTVIAKVPDLSTLGILPVATPAGALGTFIDDDGAISSVAVFVRTSIGEPGPVENGLLTWKDARLAPFSSEATPDNGPAPTALAQIGVWGREQEVVRLDRLNGAFFQGETNFTDWYYPSSGLGTTNGLPSLDTTALSVGRGRRDIANLTESMNVDIPVIAFGGTNGLTPVTGAYTPFAQSIGACAAPSCDGTPRVVDANAPNDAFPTFGGPRGGFEVHLSEGLAHLDIVTAEDDSRTEIYEPLLAFLKRNVQ